MKAKEAKLYIKKLGLEKGFNCMKQVVGDNIQILKNDEEVSTCAAEMMLRMELQYGSNISFSIFFVRNDGTAQGYMCSGGEVLVTCRVTLDEIREINEALPSIKMYILLVETKTNYFEMVTTM